MAANIEGVDGVMQVLTDLEGLDLTQALGKAGALVERGAKMKCPNDLGNLARSIQYDVEGNTCTVSAPLEYAPYVEYGTGLFAEQGGRKDVPWHYQDEEGNWHTTKGQHPQPFLRPAFNEAQAGIVQLLEGELLE